MEHKMKVTIFALVFMLSGCGIFGQTKIIEVPVYTPPKFEMPKRPSLVADESDFNKSGKAIETNLINLEKYALQLESLLNELATPKTINNK
jgi:hypothetical protein